MPSTTTTLGFTKKAKKKGLSIDEKVVLVEQWFSAHPQPYTLKELLQLIPKQTPVIYQSVEECVQVLVAEGRIEEDRVGVSTLFWKFPPTVTQQANGSCQPPGKKGGLGNYPASSAAAPGCPVSFADLLGRLTASGATAQRQQQPISTETIQRWCALTPDAEMQKWHDLLQVENEKALAALTKEGERLGFIDGSGHGEQVCEDSPAGEEAVLAELSRHEKLAQQRAQLLAEHKAISSRQALPALLDQLNRATSVALDAANRWTDNYYLAEEGVVGKSGFGGGRRDVRAALQLPLDLDYLSDESETEPNAVGGHEPEKMDGRNESCLPCTAAHDATLQRRLPPPQQNRLCNAGGSPSTQDGQPVTTVSPPDDPPSATVDAERAAPDTATTAPPVTSAKARKTKAAKPPPSKRSSGKRSRS
ncbi:hypothetical protein JKF63_05579 [Porcisia hertigi]|uniref:Mnd1 HTH domain-containing protein n=1 Tax=Porcisia hertigi TaxID=2761500 RepID=A0A836ITU6_9TRYP|nr:hypothetical protein JKF63_05579 [Porcisia hertigi]